MLVRKSLLSLALGGFGIGMTEFVMMGLLPDIAASLNVTIPKAGYLISSYALGVVVGAPLLTGFTSRYSPKNVLLALMLVFTIANGSSSLSSNYNALLVVRFLAGLPHGAYFGVGAVVASRLAEPGKSAAAVASMFAGLTIANVVGVPLGTYVGHNFGWRFTFILVALVGVVTMIGINQWIPRLEGNRDGSFIKDLVILKKVDLWLGLLLTSIGSAGFFAWFSYIAPLLTDITGFSAAAIPWIMTVAGLGMTTGNFIGGRLADAYQPIKTITGLLLSMSVLLLFSAYCAESKAAMLVLAFLTGANALAICAPIQVLLISSSQESETFGASLGQSGFNVGNALGAFLGGIPISLGYALYSAQWVGAGMALVGAVIGGMLYVRTRDSGTVA